MEKIVNGRNLDPTINVQNMLAAEIKRQDDLREAENRRINERTEGEVRRVDEKIALIAQHNKELGDKEGSRLDSIRQVDVNNQAQQAKSALDAIQTLAIQTKTDAEKIRTALDVTAIQLQKQNSELASTIAVQYAADKEAIAVRVAALEKAQAEGIGKERVTDPIMNQLLMEFKSMREDNAKSKGSGSGKEKMWGWVAAGMVLLFGGAGFVFGLITLILKIKGL